MVNQQGATNVIVVQVNQDSICGHPIPRVDPCTALIILLLNIFFPGWGTVVLGCVGYNANCCKFLLLGILQFLLVPVILIGWIWAIITGIAVLRVSGTQSVTVSSEEFITR